MASSLVSALLPRAAEKISYYQYDPSKALAILAATVFGFSCGAHFIQMVRSRAWYFAAMFIAAQMEAMGYGARMLSRGDVYNRHLFAIQFSLIVLAPVFIAASLYIVFGRLLESTLPGGPKARALGIPARWVTAIFLCSDFISFALQGGGAAFMSSATAGTSVKDKDKLSLGKSIMLAGLTVQLFSFGFFTIAAVRFDVKIRALTRGEARPRWKLLLWSLHLSCFLIILRSAFRIAEFSQGWKGYLASHEVYFYLFEALPMLPCIVIFNVFHPAKYLNSLGQAESENPGTSVESAKERV